MRHGGGAAYDGLGAEDYLRPHGAVEVPLGTAGQLAEQIVASDGLHAPHVRQQLCHGLLQGPALAALGGGHVSGHGGEKVLERAYSALRDRHVPAQLGGVQRRRAVRHDLAGQMAQELDVRRQPGARHQCVHGALAPVRTRTYAAGAGHGRVCLAVAAAAPATRRARQACGPAGGRDGEGGGGGGGGGGEGGGTGGERQPGDIGYLARGEGHKVRAGDQFVRPRAVARDAVNGRRERDGARF